MITGIIVLLVYFQIAYFVRNLDHILHLIPSDYHPLLHVKLNFNWHDFWIGQYVHEDAKAIYVCLLPMLPIKVWMTEHAMCRQCEASMDKIAINTGDGWALMWECRDHPGDHFMDIEWTFGGAWMTGAELEQHGYQVEP